MKKLTKLLALALTSLLLVTLISCNNKTNDDPSDETTTHASTDENKENPPEDTQNHVWGFTGLASAQTLTSAYYNNDGIERVDMFGFGAFNQYSSWGFEYDGDGKLSNMTVDIIRQGVRTKADTTFEAEYDGDGKPTSIKLTLLEDSEISEIIEFKLTREDGKLTEANMYIDGGHIYIAKYNADGFVREEQVKNDADDEEWLCLAYEYNGDGALEKCILQSGEVSATLSFEYGAQKCCISKASLKMSSGEDTNDILLEYNDRHQLVKISSGDESYGKTFTYTEDGTQLIMSETSVDETYSSSVTYSYDESDRLSEKLTQTGNTSEDGTVHETVSTEKFNADRQTVYSKTERTNSKDGKVTSRWVEELICKEDGAYDRRTTVRMQYDENGELTDHEEELVVYHGEDGNEYYNFTHLDTYETEVYVDGNYISATCVIVNEYDDNGNRAKSIQTYYAEDQTVVKYEEWLYEYDSEGNMIQWIILEYDQKGGELLYDSCTQYYANGMLKYDSYKDYYNGILIAHEETYYSPEDDSNTVVYVKTVYAWNDYSKPAGRIVYEYNENFVLIRETRESFDEDGNLKTETVTEYDENGNEISSTAS